VIEKVEAVVAVSIDNHEVVGTSSRCCPFLPLVTFFFFGTEDEAAEVSGKIGQRQVLGWPARFATPGGTEYDDAGQCVLDGEGARFIPVPIFNWNSLTPRLSRKRAFRHG
jgi:hypothetical protein